MDMIYAPFTTDQVQALKRYQSGETLFDTGLEDGRGNPVKTPGHPFTCCSHEGCIRSEQINDGALIPTEKGWICPCGKYTQNWAHAFMAE